MKINSLSLLAVGVLATAVFSSAQAVELQQKWQVGQQLNYDLALNGTANVKVPSDVPIFFAGVPLEIDLTGKGVARLNTLEVNPKGEGTIFVELPNFDLNGRTFGQKASVELRDGETRVLINGKPIELPKPNPSKMPPNYGLIIGKDGRVKGVKELDKNGKILTAAANAPALDMADDEMEQKPVAEKPVAAGQAIDRSALISSMIMQALPTLWPQKDVQPGESWKTTLALPAVLARDAQAAQEAEPLSEWTMTLKGQETVDGVELWRVGIVGGLQVSGDSLAAPATPKKGEKPNFALDNVEQRVNGDLWFDATKGRVVRGDMVIDARGQSYSINDKGRNSDPAWADFTGTLGLRLRGAAK